MKNKNSEVSGVFPSHAYHNKNLHRNKNTLDQGVRDHTRACGASSARAHQHQKYSNHTRMHHVIT